MATWAELMSDKALVSHKEHNSDKGVDIVWSVLASDGWLFECGRGRTGERRAIALAMLINDGGPEKLSHAAMTSARDKRG